MGLDGFPRRVRNSVRGFVFVVFRIQGYGLMSWPSRLRLCRKESISLGRFSMSCYLHFSTPSIASTHEEKDVPFASRSIEGASLKKKPNLD